MTRGINMEIYMWIGTLRGRGLPVLQFLGVPYTPHPNAGLGFRSSPNFARIHKTLRITPAMAAGVTDHVWEIDDIIALL
jgi:hypothetical protein